MVGASRAPPVTLSPVRRLGEWATNERRVVRLLIENEPKLAVFVGLWFVGAATMPMLGLLTMGRVISHIGPVLQQGWSSPAGHSLVRWIVLLGVVYGINVGLNGVRAALGTIVKVRVTYKMHERLMRSVSQPT